MSRVEIGNRNTIRVDAVLTYTVDDDATAPINLGGFPILGLLVPVMNGGPGITVEVCIDGTNWYPLRKSDGTTAAVSITGGASAFFVGSDELTQLAAFVGHLHDWSCDVQVRLRTSVAQSANRTFTFIGLG